MIYLDNAATTKLDDICLEEIKKFSQEKFFNPSSLYFPGYSNKLEIQNRKNSIKKLLNTNFDVIFTSSATEANNTVLFTSIRKNKANILISSIEHPSVYQAALFMKEKGYEIRFISVNKYGKIDEEDFLNKIDENTSLISIMHVNNEIGSINDIKKLVRISKEKNKNIIFHVDGTQAIGKIKVDLESLGVDAYTFSFHKINGPKGIGALLIRNKNMLKPLLYGGNQENGMRASTENIAYITASEKILKNKIENLDENYKKVKLLEEKLILELKKLNIEVIRDNSIFSPYIVSFYLNKIRGEVMLHLLEKKNIFVAVGSACSSNKKEKSYIQKALHVNNEKNQNMLRVSFSSSNNEEEIDIFINELKKAVKELEEIN